MINIFWACDDDFWRRVDSARAGGDAARVLIHNWNRLKPELGKPVETGCGFWADLPGPEGPGYDPPVAGKPREHGS